MPRIITLGRQFGSGGRELGRRLAEALQIAYYDHEIISEISKKTELSEAYVKSVLEQQPFSMMPINTARSLYFAPDPALSLKQSVYEEQARILREMATKSNCLIVGRCADSILSDL
ncbi:MAG: cytidylate kinase-like family protein, partial [Eubacteriales bacterium]|nr:cytidylate kinase-like family protein [Eubacteriales bacterium]